MSEPLDLVPEQASSSASNPFAAPDEPLLEVDHAAVDTWRVQRDRLNEASSQAWEALAVTRGQSTTRGAQVEPWRPSPGLSRARLVLGVAILVALTVFGYGLWSRYETPRPQVASASLAAVVQQVKASTGRVVVLHVWATWCGVCLDELPELQGAWERSDPRSVEFITVAIDESSRGVEELMVAEGVDFPTVRLAPPGERAAARQYGRLGLAPPDKVPFTAVFDRDGELLISWEGARPQSHYAAVIGQAG